MNESQSPSAAARKWTLWTGLIPLIAVLPMLYFRVAELWSDAEMRMLLLVSLLLPALIAIRIKKNSEASISSNLSSNRGAVAVGIFILGCLIYCISVWVFSPWLANLAAVLFFVGWALGHFIHHHWTTVAAWGVLLATTLGFPYAMFGDTESFLQLTAVWATSNTLDAVHVTHLWNGNSLELPGIRVLVDQVCGGWTSVYGLGAITIVLLLVGRHGLLTSIVTLLMTLLWTATVYYMRLIAISFAHLQLNRNLASGNDFVLLQLGTFLVGVLFVWLTTRVCQVLTRPIALRDNTPGPTFDFLNRSLRWPQPIKLNKPRREDEDEEENLESSSADSKDVKTKSLGTSHPTWDWQETPFSKFPVMVSSVLALLVGILPAYLMASGTVKSKFHIASVPAETVQRIASTNLPESVGKWQRVSTPADDTDGSQVDGNPNEWLYAKGTDKFSFTVSEPTIGWQDPGERWIRVGWKVSVRAKETPDRIVNTNSTETSNWPMYVAELETDLGAAAYLFASTVTQDLEPCDLIPQYMDNVPVQTRAQKITTSELLAGKTRIEDQPNLQLRLFIEPGARLPRKELYELIEHFDVLRNQAIGQEINTESPTPSE